MSDQAWACLIPIIVFPFLAITICIYNCWDRWLEHKETIAEPAEENEA